MALAAHVEHLRECQIAATLRILTKNPSEHIAVAADTRHRVERLDMSQIGFETAQAIGCVRFSDRSTVAA
jgi:hypothetical protein